MPTNILPDVLLIEDNAHDADMIMQSLSGAQLANHICLAESAEKGLEYLKHERPVAILLDLTLPGMSGLELLKKLKSHPEHQLIPVVILTASREDFDVQESYRLGANSYITKPMVFTEFQEMARMLARYWGTLNIPPKLKN